MLLVSHQLLVSHIGLHQAKVSQLTLLVHAAALCIMRHSVPSAPPEMVNVSSVHGSSLIIVRWGEVPCQHRNGEIIRYAVKYSKGQNQSEGVTVMVDGQSTTLYDLEPLTEYSIMVAAVNSNGTGQFSEPVYITTEGQQGL